MKNILLTFILLLSLFIISSLFVSCGNGNKTNNQEVNTSITVTDLDVIVINGVHWAKCNVDKPGTFATAPEEPGMFYQWNNNVGWSATNPIVNSNGGRKWGNNPNGFTRDGHSITTWATTNDPSPNGWRLPTDEEFRALLDTDKVSNEWTTLNEVNGRKFTDKISGQSIFLSAAGNRDDQSIEQEPDEENLYEVGSTGYYWSSVVNESNNPQRLGFYNNGVSIGGDSSFDFDMGYSIRCVKE